MAKPNLWLNSLLDQLYPPHCLVCGKASALVHPDCLPQMPYLREPLCPACGIPRQRDNSGQHYKLCSSPICKLSDSQRALNKVNSVFQHSGGGREAAIRLKYKGVANLSNWLGNQMAEAARQNSIADYVNLVVPVPLHAKRLRERGYNQAALLAKAVSRELNVTFFEYDLVRQRETRTQVGLGAIERANNVANAFVWQGDNLSGQNVLLIDDVCTTGATLNACAFALKEAGAERVIALTLTREFVAN